MEGDGRWVVRKSVSPACHTGPCPPVSCSPEGSSVDKPTPREVAVQLRGFVRRLQGRRALLKVPPEPGPAMTPRLTVPHAEAMVQAILDTQLGPALPRLDKKQIQQDLVATRVQMG